MFDDHLLDVSKRKMQISLRAILIILAICCLFAYWFAIATAPSPRELQAAAVNRVLVKEIGPGKPVTYADLQKLGFDFLVGKHLSELAELERTGEKVYPHKIEERIETIRKDRPDLPVVGPEWLEEAKGKVDKHGNAQALLFHAHRGLLVGDGAYQDELLLIVREDVIVDYCQSPIYDY